MAWDLTSYTERTPEQSHISEGLEGGYVSESALQRAVYIDDLVECYRQMLEPDHLGLNPACATSCVIFVKLLLCSILKIE